MRRNAYYATVSLHTVAYMRHSIVYTTHCTVVRSANVTLDIQKLIIGCKMVSATRTTMLILTMNVSQLGVILCKLKNYTK